MGGVADHVGLADRETVGGELALEREAEAGLQHPIAGGVAQPLLGQHDALLLVERGLVQQQIAGHFAQQHHRGVDGVVVGLGQVELVDRLVPRGGGVGVGAEGQAVALQHVDHLAARHMGRAVERHVFQEVGQALLLGRFVQRAGMDAQAQRGLAAGRGVLHHHIAQAVGQGPKPHPRIRRQVGIALRPHVHWRRLADRATGDNHGRLVDAAKRKAPVPGNGRRRRRIDLGFSRRGGGLGVSGAEMRGYGLDGGAGGKRQAATREKGETRGADHR